MNVDEPLRLIKFFGHSLEIKLKVRMTQTLFADDDSENRSFENKFGIELDVPVDDCVENPL